MIEPLIYLLVVIGIVCLIAWAITQLVPMPPKVQTVVWVVAILIILLVLLRYLPGALPDTRLSELMLHMLA